MKAPKEEIFLCMEHAIAILKQHGTMYRTDGDRLEIAPYHKLTYTETYFKLAEYRWHIPEMSITRQDIWIPCPNTYRELLAVIT